MPKQATIETTPESAIYYEPIPGYSRPVVRVSDAGRVLFTLSFTDLGFPFARPDAATDAICAGAWQAWKEKCG